MTRSVEVRKSAWHRTIHIFYTKTQVKDSHIFKKIDFE
jgi:hypothetical protein